MLEIRPNCEYCDKDLPPESTEAHICSYECTFCADCVDNILLNVCPNCGGGLTPRPVRPVTARREGLSISHQPPSTTRKHLKHDKEAVAAFVTRVKDIPPDQR